MSTRKTDERFTGYMIWDDSVLYQQWEYILREWDANALRWIATKGTEWRKVPTKSPALANVVMSNGRRQPINLLNTMNDKPASESPEVVTSKGIGSSALVGFFALAERFEGVDLQCRRGWISVWNPSGKWRARLVVNKNERCKYRVEEWGTTAEEAAQRVVTRVSTIDLCSA